MAVSPKHAISGKLERNQALPFRNSHYKSVLCELCGKKFPLPANLRDHMQVHTGEKKYKCEICPKRYTTKFVAKAHMLNSHSDNPTRLPCGVCHKDFRNLSNLYRHMRSHQDTRPLYKCDICDKTFTTLVGRNQHVAHVHHKVPRSKRNRRDRRPNTRRLKTNM
ncbi:zinc finger protein 766-like [Maniola jurtina]|uniref:zinc finger protein 766-like n=1 Tax=Maniola jurtina TaxID=191418 RepID=UPI001E68C90D|nr:zinc finger protein 766-like [Maniola jurtina]